MKTIKVTTDNVISIIDINLNDFRAIQKELNGHFENVRTKEDVPVLQPTNTVYGG